MGPNNDMAEVSAVVRQKIAAGVLPTDKPMKMWVGKGTGLMCDACDLPVTPADIETRPICRVDAPSASINRASQCGMRSASKFKSPRGSRRALSA